MPRFHFDMDWLAGDDLAGGTWQRVTGEELPWPVLIRMGETAQGRPIVTGLIIGDGNPSEITSDGLRKIPIGAIIGQLFQDYDPAAPPSWNNDLHDQVVWGLMNEAVSRGPVVPAEHAAPARGPSDDDLRQIADIYRREIKRNPRRAMTATAEAFPTTRQTANRWIRMCRERGYLPSK